MGGEAFSYLHDLAGDAAKELGVDVSHILLAVSQLEDAIRSFALSSGQANGSYLQIGIDGNSFFYKMFIATYRQAFLDICPTRASSVCADLVPGLAKGYDLFRKAVEETLDQVRKTLAKLDFVWTVFVSWDNTDAFAEDKRPTLEARKKQRDAQIASFFSDIDKLLTNLHAMPESGPASRRCRQDVSRLRVAASKSFFAVSPGFPLQRKDFTDSLRPEWMLEEHLMQQVRENGLTGGTFHFQSQGEGEMGLYRLWALLTELGHGTSANRVLISCDSDPVMTQPATLIRFSLVPPRDADRDDALLWKLIDKQLLQRGWVFKDNFVTAQWAVLVSKADPTAGKGLKGYGLKTCMKDETFCNTVVDAASLKEWLVNQGGKIAKSALRQFETFVSMAEPGLKAWQTLHQHTSPRPPLQPPTIPDFILNRKAESSKSTQHEANIEFKDEPVFIIPKSPKQIIPVPNSHTQAMLSRQPARASFTHANERLSGPLAGAPSTRADFVTKNDRKQAKKSNDADLKLAVGHQDQRDRSRMSQSRLSRGGKTQGKALELQPEDSDDTSDEEPMVDMRTAAERFQAAYDVRQDRLDHLANSCHKTGVAGKSLKYSTLQGTLNGSLRTLIEGQYGRRHPLAETLRLQNIMRKIAINTLQDLVYHYFHRLFLDPANKHLLFRCKDSREIQNVLRGLRFASAAAVSNVVSAQTRDLAAHNLTRYCPETNMLDRVLDHMSSLDWQRAASSVMVDPLVLSTLENVQDDAGGIPMPDSPQLDWDGILQGFAIDLTRTHSTTFQASLKAWMAQKLRDTGFFIRLASKRRKLAMNLALAVSVEVAIGTPIIYKQRRVVLRLSDAHTSLLKLAVTGRKEDVSDSAVAGRVSAITSIVSDTLQLLALYLPAACKIPCTLEQFIQGDVSTKAHNYDIMDLLPCHHKLKIMLGRERGIIPGMHPTFLAYDHYLLASYLQSTRSVSQACTILNDSIIPRLHSVLSSAVHAGLRLPVNDDRQEGHKHLRVSELTENQCFSSGSRKLLADSLGRVDRRAPRLEIDQAFLISHERLRLTVLDRLQVNTIPNSGLRSALAHILFRSFPDRVPENFIRFNGMRLQSGHAVLSRGITAAAGLSPRDNFLRLAANSSSFNADLTARVEYGREFLYEDKDRDRPVLRPDQPSRILPLYDASGAPDHLASSRCNKVKPANLNHRITRGSYYIDIPDIEKDIKHVREKVESFRSHVAAPSPSGAGDRLRNDMDIEASSDSRFRQRQDYGIPVTAVDVGEVVALAITTLPFNNEGKRVQRDILTRAAPFDAPLKIQQANRTKLVPKLLGPHTIEGYRDILLNNHNIDEGDFRRVQNVLQVLFDNSPEILNEDFHKYQRVQALDDRWLALVSEKMGLFSKCRRAKGLPITDAGRHADLVTPSMFTSSSTSLFLAGFAYTNSNARKRDGRRIELRLLRTLIDRFDTTHLEDVISRYIREDCSSQACPNPTCWTKLETAVGDYSAGQLVRTSLRFAVFCDSKRDCLRIQRCPACWITVHRDKSAAFNMCAAADQILRTGQHTFRMGNVDAHDDNDDAT